MRTTPQEKRVDEVGSGAVVLSGGERGWANGLRERFGAATGLLADVVDVVHEAMTIARPALEELLSLAAEPEELGERWDHVIVETDFVGYEELVEVLACWLKRSAGAGNERDPRARLTPAEVRARLPVEHWRPAEVLRDAAAALNAAQEALDRVRTFEKHAHASPVLADAALEARELLAAARCLTAPRSARAAMRRPGGR